MTQQVTGRSLGRVLNEYKEAYPYAGMPLGVTGLSDSEHRTLLEWIEQGAPFSLPAIQLSALEQREIQTWEKFFNHESPRRQLTARWLYEHLFIAHLYFKGIDSQHYFQIVRSSTPSGKPIEPIATRQPNDDPGKPFFYRLQPVQGTIMYKTHVTLALDNHLLSRINALFFDDNWTVDHLPGYTDAERSNPFQTFAPIPAEARYRFMLDHAEYFVQTFSTRTGVSWPDCHGRDPRPVLGIVSSAGK